MFIPSERFVKVGKVNTRYFAEGEGSPVILIHGLSGSASGWLTSFGPLCEKHRVYAPDMPGQGKTDAFPTGPYDLPAYARFISDFMQEMKLESADIAGHSWGGAIALRVAMDFPARLRKLVLVDALGLGRETLPLYSLVSIPLLGELLAGLDEAPNAKKFAEKVRAGLKNPGNVTDKYLGILYADEHVPPHYPTTLKILRTTTNLLGQKRTVHEAITRHLPSITNPTLVIWGRQDGVLPLRHGELAARLLPNARFEPLDNCDHIPQFEHPDLVNRLLLDFLGG